MGDNSRDVKRWWQRHLEQQLIALLAIWAISVSFMILVATVGYGRLNPQTQPAWSKSLGEFMDAHIPASLAPVATAMIFICPLIILVVPILFFALLAKLLKRDI